jgi:hypothetical protein
MPGVEGFEALDQILAIDAGIDVMMVTGNDSAETAVEAIQRGAFDYVTKPVSIERLHKRLGGWLEDSQRRKQTLRLDRELVQAFQFAGIIGRSPAIWTYSPRFAESLPILRTPSSPARRVRGRNWRPKRSTHWAKSRPALLSSVTVPRFPNICLKVNYLATCEEPLQGPIRTERDL